MADDDRHHDSLHPGLIVTGAQVRENLHIGTLIETMATALADFSTGAATQPVRTVIPANDGYLFIMPAFQWVASGLDPPPGARLMPRQAAHGPRRQNGVVLPAKHGRPDPHGHDHAVRAFFLAYCGLTARVSGSRRRRASRWRSWRAASSPSCARRRAWSFPSGLLKHKPPAYPHKAGRCSAVATRLLARPGATVLAILGSGAQAQAHWEVHEAWLLARLDIGASLPPLTRAWPPPGRCCVRCSRGPRCACGAGRRPTPRHWRQPSPAPLYASRPNRPSAAPTLSSSPPRQKVRLAGRPAGWLAGWLRCKRGGEYACTLGHTYSSAPGVQPLNRAGAARRVAPAGRARQRRRRVPPRLARNGRRGHEGGRRRRRLARRRRRRVGRRCSLRRRGTAAAPSILLAAGE